MSEAYYQDDWLTLHAGDARNVLRELPAESVHMVVTSPPYWGLRDYGIEPTVWGGDPHHEHEWDTETLSTEVGKGNWAQGVNGRGEAQPGGVAAKREPIRATAVRGFCSCGAWLGTLGLEPTPEQYVDNMVAVFREIRRVLRADGTVWLNLGDSYAANGGARGYGSSDGTTGRADAPEIERRPPSLLKAKDLVGIPWRVAFALQAEGWYLRKDIIWAKKNTMPESVRDRPTTSHEYIFLLSKSARYFYDADAVREAFQTDEAENYPARAKIIGRGDQPSSNASLNQPQQDKSGGFPPSGSGRNLRDVWWMATQPYPGAHFAVFPPKLPEKCILAGTSARGVCTACGAPWERVVERTAHSLPVKERKNRQGHNGMPPQQSGWYWKAADVEECGWQRACAHDGEPVPATVLDPFAGSGTTGMIAQKLGRKAVLIDLNPEYLKQQLVRNAQVPLGLSA